MQEAINLIKEHVASMPEASGIYKMLDKNGQLLYVGKAKMLPKRVSSYANIAALSNRIKLMVSQIADIEVIVTANETEALLLEASLIKSQHPKYNIMLRDAKSFAYICIDVSKDFPIVEKRRKTSIKNAIAFGPFVSSKAVNQTIDELQKIFLLRSCTDSFFNSRQRPCLQYEIKRCSAPCVNKITKQEYRQNLVDAVAFLRGKNKAIENKLSQEMHELSNQLEFEKAALIRDRLALLRQMIARHAFSSTENDIDLFALYVDQNKNSALQVFIIRNGQNYGGTVYFQSIDCPSDEALQILMLQFYQNNIPPSLIINNLTESSSIKESLKIMHNVNCKIKAPKTSRQKHYDLLQFALDNAKLALSKHLAKELKHAQMLDAISKLFDSRPIERLEVYDNSHLSGSDAVGCMIVATKHGFDKSQYRTYNIKAKDGTNQTNDDYEMLRQVLRRRVKHFPNNTPDLIIIDGGAGQLSAALEILGQYNVTVVGMSKGEDRNAGREFFHSKDRQAFQLPKNDPVLLYLQSLRNEAHRFAIASHRKKRARNFI